ncbi:MAG: helix-turn-helix transcriptional regulator [Dehalococcoidia bacterium]
MERIRHREPAITGRQREVWRLVAGGHTNAEIAALLGISLDGAKWHVGELLDRLDASSRDELADRWHDEHRLANRARHWLRSLALVPSLKLAAAVSGVTLGAGAAAVAGVLIYRASGAATADEPGAPLPVVTQRTEWTPEEALRRARAEVAVMLAEPDLAAKFARPLAVRDLTLASARFAPGAMDVDFSGAGRLDNYWTYHDGVTRDAWYFAFTAKQVALRDGRGPLGDVTIEVLLEDGKPGQLASQVYVESTAGTEVASSSGVRSRGAESMGAAALLSQRVASFDGHPDAAWLGVFRSPTGTYCYATFSATGLMGMRMCIGGDPASLAPAEVSVTPLGWTGVDSQPQVIVRTPANVYSVRITAGGEAKTVATGAPPPDWPVEERFALLSAGRWGETFTITAFDATGNQLGTVTGGTTGAP